MVLFRPTESGGLPVRNSKTRAFFSYKTCAYLCTCWSLGEGALDQFAFPASYIPTGMMHFQSGTKGRDDPVQWAPDSWIARDANVTFSHTHPAGGHFAAEEEVRNFAISIHLRHFAKVVVVRT